MSEFKSFTIIKDGGSTTYMVMDEEAREKIGYEIKKIELIT